DSRPVGGAPAAGVDVHLAPRFGCHDLLPRANGRLARIPVFAPKVAPRPLDQGRYMSAANGHNVGKIVEIKGVVIDAEFEGHLPTIYSALEISVPAADGGSTTLVAEVQQHLGDNRVRAIAMDATDGLARGLSVTDTGARISVPVGEVTLGRIFNVLGEPVDHGDPVPA